MRYKKRISGPILDRIDLHVNVPAVEVEKLEGAHHGAHHGGQAHDGASVQDSAKIRKRVAAARKIQEKRFEIEEAPVQLFNNAQMRNKQIKKFCLLEPKVQGILKLAVNISLICRLGLIFG